MTKPKAADPIPIDLHGLRLLGTALLLQAEYQRDDFHPRAFKLSEAGFIDTEVTKNERAKAARSGQGRAVCFRMALKAIDAPSGLSEIASALRPCDFRFRWNHIFQHKWLAPYLKPRSDLGALIDLDTPIAKRWDGRELRALEGVFWGEYRLPRDCSLNVSDHDYPEPRTEDELWFALSFAELLEKPNSRGGKEGQRYADGLAHAAKYAWGLRHRQHIKKREGERDYRYNEAVHLALKKFKHVESVGDLKEDTQIVACSEDLMFRRVLAALMKIEAREPSIPIED